MQGVKSASTVNRYFMSIRSFCAFLRKRKHIADDLTEDISIPVAKQKAPRILTIQEIEKLLTQPENLRDKAILELLYSSGLRASELCDLSLEDLGQDNIRVVCGKRGKTRTVPMTQAAIRAIEAYVQERGKEEGYLFLTLNRKQLRRQVVCKMIERNARKAGLERVTTHSLRHACATHLLDSGADLRLIQEVLGHSSIASTQRYTHLSSNKMKSMFEQFHPRKVI